MDIVLLYLFIGLVFLLGVKAAASKTLKGDTDLGRMMQWPFSVGPVIQGWWSRAFGKDRRKDD